MSANEHARDICSIQQNIAYEIINSMRVNTRQVDPLTKRQRAHSHHSKEARTNYYQYYINQSLLKYQLLPEPASSVVSRYTPQLQFIVRSISISRVRAPPKDFFWTKNDEECALRAVYAPLDGGRQRTTVLNLPSRDKLI